MGDRRSLPRRILTPYTYGSVAAITTMNAAMAAGNAMARASAARGARPRDTRISAGAAVTRNSATIAKPAALSRPFVAASDREPKVTDAAKRKATVSSNAMMSVARRNAIFVYDPAQTLGPVQNR